jgi:hypothetical protein
MAARCWAGRVMKWRLGSAIIGPCHVSHLSAPSSPPQPFARVRERLQDPDLRPGIARELRKHIDILEREISELE